MTRTGTAPTSARRQREYVKRWSYAEITDQTEAYIRRSMALHVEANQGSKKPYYDGHKMLAFGALLAWKSLTQGWQKPGDDDRLEALINETKMRS